MRFWYNRKERNNLKISIIIVVCFIGILLIGVIKCCGSHKVEIHPIVDELLNKISIEKSSIISIGNYSDISYHLDTPYLTEEEINEYEDTIKRDYGVEEFTLDFMQDYFEVSSYEEFREYLSTRALNSKKITDLLKCREDIMNKLVGKVKFNLDEDEIAKYSLEIVKKYEELARIDGLTIEEYCVNELQISYDNFFEMCYEEGEQEIKDYLIIGGIAERECGGLTEEELKEGYDGEGQADIYWCYQQIENEVYSLFIHVDGNY